MPSVVNLRSDPLKVGATSLLKIAAFDGVAVYAKAEWENPGGSVKDRPALAIIRAAQARGLLGKGKRLLDATSGNTGIGYAWICRRLGYRLRITASAKISAERRKRLEEYGAELTLTDPMEGSDGAIRAARAIAAKNSGRYYYADQYNNPANPRAHYETTAPEIWEQTEGRITHFVAGLGTSGTFCGCAKRLRELRPDVRLVSAQPASALHALEGWKHMDSAMVPGIYDPKLADEELVVTTEEGRAEAARQRDGFGLNISASGGANVAAALRVGRNEARAGRRAVIVTILPDGGDR